MRLSAILRELAWRDDYVSHAPAPGGKIETQHVDKPVRNQDLHPANLRSMAHHSRAPDDLNALDDYKKSSMHANLALRAGFSAPQFVKPVQVAPIIRGMKNLTGHRLAAPQTTYRGNKMDVFYPKGERFSDRGFTSTSLDHETALENADPTSGSFAIHSPVGAKAYHVDLHHNRHQNEQEMTLHPDTHYEVVGHTYHPSRSGSTHHAVTHLAVVGNGHGPDGTPDSSLTETPEGKAWLDHVRKNHAEMIV